MRFIQHKKEAFWFYRFLSLGYDRYVNPLFWTVPMRTEALAAARLDGSGLETLDVGAGTGFATEGIVAHVAPAHVTMLDQSPHQLARGRRKPALEACRRVLGDAERLPFADGRFDRYVSTGSIEYWPEPQRAIAEAFRVLRPGGVALIAGPLPPANRLLRWLAEAWMLFPPEADYRAWFARAGFADVAVRHIAPGWHREGDAPYAVAVSGVRPADGSGPATGAETTGAPADAIAATAGARVAAPSGPAEDLHAPMTLARRLRFAGRFAAGSLAGAAFVPVALALALRARVAARRDAAARSG